MSAQILPPPATGDPYDNPHQYQRFQPSPAESRYHVVPPAGLVPDAAGAVGRMGDPSGPTVPSARRRSEGLRSRTGALPSNPVSQPAPAPDESTFPAAATARPVAGGSPMPLRQGWSNASAPFMAVPAAPNMSPSVPAAMAQSAPLHPPYPVAVASVPWTSTPLSPFGGAVLPMAPSVPPMAPPVPLTHSPAEPAESEPRLTDDDYGYGIAHIVLPGCPHPVYTFLRQWTPAFVPSVEGGLVLAIALALLFNNPALGANLAGFGGIFSLFAIYLAGGALFGVALYFARSDAAWFITLLMGGMLLPALILSPLLGAAYAVPALLGTIAIGLLFLRYQQTQVGEGRVAVTKLFGRYFRVVRLDHFLRLPFERVVALLDATERVFTTPIVYAELYAPSGTGYRARATCTATYAILPAEAQRVVPVLSTWEHDLQQQVLRALHEALTEWATHATITGSPPPRGTLSRDMMADVRQWAQRHGIWLMRVRVHNIWLQPLSDTSWAPGGPVNASGALSSGSISQSAIFQSAPMRQGVPPSPLSPSEWYPHSSGHLPEFFGLAGQARGVGQSPSRPSRDIARPPSSPFASALSAQPAASVPVDVVTPARMSMGHPNSVAHRLTAQVMPAGQMLGQTPDEAAAGSRVGDSKGHAALPGAPPTAADYRSVAPSAPRATEPLIVSPASTQALVAAYEEVRLGRITDPATIREIARAFRLVEEHPPADPFPYDGDAAAHVLDEYAARLER